MPKSNRKKRLWLKVARLIGGGQVNIEMRRWERRKTPRAAPDSRVYRRVAEGPNTMSGPPQPPYRTVPPNRRSSLAEQGPEHTRGMGNGFSTVPGSNRSRQPPGPLSTRPTRPAAVAAESSSEESNEDESSSEYDTSDEDSSDESSSDEESDVQPRPQAGRAQRSNRPRLATARESSSEDSSDADAGDSSEGESSGEESDDNGRTQGRQRPSAAGGSNRPVTGAQSSATRPAAPNASRRR